MKGAKLIVETIKEEKVSHIFGYPGGAIMPVYDVLYDEKNLRHILTRHEQGAVHAAEGFARASGKPGVCMTTSGPGATNTITGLADAYMDSVPVIVFSGQVPVQLIGNDAFQEADMIGLTMPITKHNYQLKKTSQIYPSIKEAFYVATHGRPGPVFIDLPKNVQLNEAKKPQKIRKMNMPGFKPNLEPHPVQIRKAAELIMSASYPVILAGGGTIISGASKELREFAELSKAPVVTTLMAKGVFPEQHPQSMGMLGMHGRKCANYAVTQADLLIAVGCRFSDRITGNVNTFCRDAKVIHIDIDSAEIGKIIDVDVPIVGDAKLSLKELNARLKDALKKGKTNNEWGKHLLKIKEACDCDIGYDEKPIRPERVIKEMNDFIDPKDIVVTEVGQHQMYAGHFLKRSVPRTFITSGGLGTMGYGFPASIGAKVACPEVEVYDIAGDGSFQMNQQELATCKESGIKIVPVIFNNGYLGMVRQWQELFFDRRYASTDLCLTDSLPDFVKLAQAYKLEGVRVCSPGDIREALKRAKKSKETFIIDVTVERESNILPMLPPGGSLSDFFGGCMRNKKLTDIFPRLS